MPNAHTSAAPPTLTLRLPSRPNQEPGASVPRLLQNASRAGDAAADLFLDGVLQVESTVELASPSRGDVHTREQTVGGERILALEAADGTTVFMRADRLREELARLHPAAVGEDGSLDLSVLRDPQATSRGALDFVWSRVSVLSLSADALIDKAREKALEWLQEWLGEKAEDLAYAGASWLGTKALMWAIESQLGGEPGLYQWRGGELATTDRCGADDARLLVAAQAGPMLVLIHGTGSSTVGSYKDLRAAGAAEGDWQRMTERYGDRVFGFEHRTFSESPIDNALLLAETLPAGARLSLMTHSRGGLVGDLMCLAGLDEEAIRAYRRNLPRGKKESRLERRLREKVAADEQAKLRRLVKLLDSKRFIIERYVRVASPARGTTLLSDNLDVFLSGLLTLTVKAAGLFTGPTGSLLLSAFKRIVLEIAEKRIEPHLVPGIEAMLTDSPLTTLLAHAQRRPGLAMAVIAGDIEGGGVLKRLGAMFTDWMFFDLADNDLVVDTESMYAGLAVRSPPPYLFDQGESVTHFGYFANRRTRSALTDWLTVAQPEDLESFAPPGLRMEPTPQLARERAATRAAPVPDSRPVVIFLPGIMGSHLELFDEEGGEGNAGDRIWFDPVALFSGGLGKIRMGGQNAAARVRAEALFDMFYGDLASHLELSHTVVRFPYDWRRPVPELADELAKVLAATLKLHPSQPVRVLAHSMGGLVTRAMIARHDTLWGETMNRRDSRFVMLGTPNNGSHLMVETLLGKSATIRNLARLDMGHDLQGVLDIVAGFPGSLQLLPRPGFRDRAGEQRDDYFNVATWEALRVLSRDRWFGDAVAGVPVADTLTLARELWDAVLPDNNVPFPDKVCYVFGQADNTPCGLRLEGERIKMLGTPEGDGSVSWLSGKLDNLPPERCWHMDADHAALTNTADHFEAIVELLARGETAGLGRLPVSRSATAAMVAYDAPPPVLPLSAEEVARGLIGGKPRRRRSKVARENEALQVAVRAMDLRFAQQPVMCGHYIGDPIAGAEAAIDGSLTGGALSKRERLGVYAGEIGTCAVVMQARTKEDALRGTGRGAVVVGLGEFGELTTAKLTETARGGVLRFLLHTHDREAGMAQPGAPVRKLTLCSLLMGHNSSTTISLEESISAIVAGACAANRQFLAAMPDARLQVGRLEFIEMFQDVAISAAHAVRNLPQRMAAELRRLDARLDCSASLQEGVGARPRLAVRENFGYWPRLTVTSATPADKEGNVIAERLRYIFSSDRARAESVEPQRQPGLIESLVKQAIRTEQTNADLSRLLFQLMVPVDYKAVAREMERLLLMVDGYTANLPWEMLQAEDEPMVLKTAVVRQLVSTRFRRNVQSVGSKTACIIVDPSTQGYRSHFGRIPVGAVLTPETDCLPALPGAVEEGDEARRILEARGYDVEYVPSGMAALDVLSRAFRRPSRILMIAAHGVYRERAADGSERTGVVLSDGMLLSAAEIGQLETVPDLVFLNCCHLGEVDSTPLEANKLAYSVSRELIEMGVRCVVAAGWKVNDQAARVFATTFFDRFVREGMPFGDAVAQARRATYYEVPGCNTWGAYQAYGDPGYVLEPGEGSLDAAPPVPVSPSELVASFAAMRTDASHHRSRVVEARRAVTDRLRGVPAAWLERSDVQEAIAQFYADIGPEAFTDARDACLKAIAADDGSGVSVRLFELLGNIEARLAVQRNDSLSDALRVDMLDAAVRRLQALVELSRDAGGINRERYVLLGSALKRKAGLLAQQGRAWPEVSATLVMSRDAYRVVVDDCGDEECDPYAALNWLNLEALITTRMPTSARELADRCVEVARSKFAQSLAFFDAAAVADATLTQWLITGSVVQHTGAGIRMYGEALASLPRSGREADSVISQVELLGTLYQARAAKGDGPMADALIGIASALRSDGQEATPAVTGPAAGARSAKPARTARKAAGAAKKAKPATSAQSAKAAKAGEAAGATTAKPPRKPATPSRTRKK
ncbi:MAG: CHAT domain-containing protein [Moraxellaceae bacterium]|nr:CHAT domain-containing protein [Moraxellaceae bacterium]